MLLYHLFWFETRFCINTILIKCFFLQVSIRINMEHRNRSQVTKPFKIHILLFIYMDLCHRKVVEKRPRISESRLNERKFAKDNVQ